MGLVTDIGGLNDRSFNQLANEGLEKAKSDLGVETRVLVSKANSDYVPNLSTLAQQKYDLVIGVGFLMAEAMDTVASKFPDTKFAIIDVDATGLKSKPTNVVGAALQGAGGRLPRRLHGRPLPQGRGRRNGRLGRRPEDPAGRPLHRRLPGGREGRQPGREGRQRVLAEVRRPGALQGDRARPDLQGREGHLPGRGRLRPRRARRGEGEERPGHRRRRRPGLPRRADHDLGAQEGRRRGLQRDQGGPGRHVQGRRQHDLRRQVGGRGHRRHERGRRQVRRRGQGRVQDKIASGELADIPDTVK